MNIRLHTELCDLLGIEHPLILAGMAGGPGTDALVAAVSGAGGLGTLGGAYMKPEEIRASIRNIRKQTDRPFAVNLFVPTPPREAAQPQEALELLNAQRAELGLEPLESPPSQPADAFPEQFAVLIEERVPVISTAFGVLPAPQMKEARSAGAKVVAMATSVEEAVWAEAQGADVIVAQGGEAGGHRGTFDVRKHPLGCSVGTFALVPQVADRVRVPVVAAGGVMDGRGLVAALVLGAKGVQMGTRFLTSAESGAHPAYKQALLQSDETSTEITTAFSGRPARGVKNRFMQQWSESGTEPFPFPLQNALTREIRNAAAAQHNAQYMSLWAGQGQRMLTPGEPAAVIFRRIIREAQEILG